MHPSRVRPRISPLWLAEPGPMEFDPERETAPLVFAYGRKRRFSDATKKEWVFLIAAIVGFFATLGLTIDRFIEEPKNTPTITVELVILLSIVLNLVFVFVGLFWERPYEVFMHVILSPTIVLYCAIHFAQTYGQEDKKTEILKGIRLAIMEIIGLFNVIFGLYISYGYRKNRDCLFRKAGRDLDLRGFYHWKFSTQSLLEINLLFELSLVVLVLKDGFYTLTVFQTIVLSVGVVYALAWCSLGFIAMRFKSTKLVYGVLASGVLGLAYIIVLLIYMTINWQKPPLSAIIITASTLGFIIKVVTCGCLFKVSQKFDNGTVAGSVNSVPEENTSRM